MVTDLRDPLKHVKYCNKHGWLTPKECGYHSAGKTRKKQYHCTACDRDRSRKRHKPTLENRIKTLTTAIETLHKIRAKDDSI